MKRLLVVILVCAILMGAFAACGQSDTGKNNSSQNGAETTVEAGTGSPGGNEDNGQEEDPGEAPETIKAEGIYVGQIDGHSIEITVDGKPMALQHGEELISALDKLNSGDKVVFSYYENEYGQPVLTKIDKAAVQ